MLRKLNDMDELRTIARPYAKAVFELAASSGTLTEWSEFLKGCSELLNNNEIRALIKAPGQNKKKVAEVFYDGVNLGVETHHSNRKQFLGLIQILSGNSRLNIMNELHKQYNQKKRESEKTTEVTLTTAIQTDEKELKKITHTLEKKLGNKVDLKVIIDKSLIGGAVIQTGDHMVDGAVSTQLQSLNRFLIN